MCFSFAEDHSSSETATGTAHRISLDVMVSGQRVQNGVDIALTPTPGQEPEREMDENERREESQPFANASRRSTRQDLFSSMSGPRQYLLTKISHNSAIPQVLHESRV